MGSYRFLTSGLMDIGFNGFWISCIEKRVLDRKRHNIFFFQDLSQKSLGLFYCHNGKGIVKEMSKRDRREK
jgi:hypothetical protein